MVRRLLLSLLLVLAPIPTASAQEAADDVAAANRAVAEAYRAGDFRRATEAAVNRLLKKSALDRTRGT